MTITLQDRDIQMLAQADFLNWLTYCLSDPDSDFSDCVSLSKQEIVTLSAVAFKQETTSGDASTLLDFQDVITQMDVSNVREDYFRLFNSSTSCSPNETAYIRRDKGAILGDLCGYYQAFGFRPHPHVGERPDHIIAELEFVSLLLTKGSLSIRDHDSEKEEVILCAGRSFSNDHLNEWIASFCLQLNQAALTPFYQGLSVQIYDVWNRINAANGWGALVTGEPPVDEDDLGNAFECGCVDPGLTTTKCALE